MGIKRLVEGDALRPGEWDKNLFEDWAKRLAAGENRDHAGDRAAAAAPGPARTAGAVAPGIASAALPASPSPGFLPPLPPVPLYDLNGAKDQVKEGAAGGAKAGDLVGITAHSTDPDGGAITYALLSDSSKGGFALDAKTGVISVKDPAKLDYETAIDHQHKLTIEARDWDDLFTVKTFTVTLLNVNETPGPITDADLTANQVKEGAASGGVLAGAAIGITAKASDPDGDALSYAIVSDTSKGGFAIDAKSGVVSVADPAKLDREAAASQAITVKASDGSGLSSLKSFTIALLDVNEAPGPILDIDAVTDTVAENAAAGAPTGLTIKAIDPEGETVLYGLLDDAGGRFQIDAKSGVISVKDPGQLDFETAPKGRYTVTVKAQDAGGLFSTQDFVIAVGNRSDTVDLATAGLHAVLRIDGAESFDYSGNRVAAGGDVNGDGIADLIIGANKSSPGGKYNAGIAYLLFGKAGGLGADAIVLPNIGGFADPATGSRLVGSVSQSGIGYAIAAGGDVNGDGFGDLLIGALLADSDGKVNIGSVYVLFGKSGGFADIDLADLLPPASGFRIDGAAPAGFTGCDVAGTGDVNGDGFDDLTLGARAADPGGKTDAGSSYVVYGGDLLGLVTHRGTAAADSLAGTAAAEVMIGGLGDDALFGGGGGDVIRGGGGNDVIHAGSDDFFRIDGGGGADSLAFAYAGDVDLGNIDGDVATSDRGRIQGIEILDVTNGAPNTVILRLADLLDLDVISRDVGGVAGLDNVLKLEGEVGDALKLRAADDWSAPNHALLPGYAIYSKGGIELAVSRRAHRPARARVGAWARAVSR